VIFNSGLAVNSKYYLFIVASIVLVLAGCFQNERSVTSQPITLYRDTVNSGNSMTSLVNHNDPNGVIALKHCEDLRELYEKQYFRRFICSSESFSEFIPKIRWVEVKKDDLH
jgi:hypothetical protein